jgi:hypothetical protein
MGDALADWHGRIDRLLAAFLDIHHAPSAVGHMTTPLPTPAPRQRLISKVVVEPDELEDRVREHHGAQLDAQVDELLKRHALV